MDLDAAVTQVVDDWLGRERFEAARVHAWQTAEGTGTRREPPEPSEPPTPHDVVMVPHDLHDVLFPGDDDPLPGADDLLRHRVVFALYRLMPCYALIMPTPTVRTPEVLSLVAEQLSALLDEPDPRLADPVAYHLWCGEFESGPEASAWIWEALTDGVDSHPRRLRRLLGVSGPVDWSLKRDLLRRLHTDSAWRHLVDEAIENARRDVFGSVDERDVQSWS